MYETVKIVNGYEIKRMKGTHGAYHINVREISKGFREFHTFTTQKAAAAFAESLPTKKSVNPMCLNCTKYNNGCNGETNPVFTGCIFKEVTK